MTIPYVDAQLSIWGKAQMAAAREGLGYGSVCPMFRDSGGGGYRSAPPLGVTLSASSDIDDTDRAIQRLPAVDRQLVIEVYVVRGTASDIAARLGVCRKTLYNRLDVLHQQVLGLLNDVVAGG